MPRNTAEGPIMGLFSLFLGFALIWHIWWLVGLGAIGMFVTFMFRIFNDDTDYHIPAAEVEKTEREYHKRLELQA
jgi:cytochrome o ubiquinol oxidase subunit 1